MDYHSFLRSKKNDDKELRPYQNNNKNRIYEAWEHFNAVMLQMPTGTGKTRLFVSILRDIHNYAAQIKNQIKVLILVHRIELIDQISNELGVGYGLAHGIIHSQDRERPKYPFQIASVQTLNRRLERWREHNFDFIIVDEAHHVLAESYRKIINMYSSAKVLGVTATPYRLSGAGFKPEFEVLIESDSIKEFIKQGYLCDYEYYSIAPYSPIQRQIEEIKNVDSSGDFANAELMAICDKDKIRAEIVETYKKYANGKKGIVYAINKLHNKHLCKSFCEEGFSAVAIDSDTPNEERERLIQQFKQGKINIICNVDIFSEGFDCPDIEFVQLARPTKSLSLYLQQVGRGLRVSEGKEKTIFLDNVGLYNRFGVPAMKRHWNDYFVGVEGIVEKVAARDKNNKHNVVKRAAKDLSEGSENVYLIHSTSDIDYLYERAKLACDWVLENIVLYDLYIANLKEPTNFLDKQPDKSVILKNVKVNKRELSKTGIELVYDNSNIIELWFRFIAAISDVSAENKQNFDKLFECDVFTEVEINDSLVSLKNIIDDTVDTIDKYRNNIRLQYFKYCLGNAFKNVSYKAIKKEIKKQRIGYEECKALFPIYLVAERFFPEEKDNIYDELLCEHGLENAKMRKMYFNYLLMGGKIEEYFNEKERKVIEILKKS